MSKIKTGAAYILFALLISVIIYHVLIILKIISYQHAWGGRLDNDVDMYTFESVSLCINIIMLFFVLFKLKYLKINISTRLVKGVFMSMFFLFALNTLGNLNSLDRTEKLFFSPLTLLLSLCSLLLAIEKKKKVMT